MADSVTGIRINGLESADSSNVTDNDYLVNMVDDIFLEATTWVLNNKKER